MTDSSDDREKITEALRACRNGDPEALNKSLPIILDKLHRLARIHFSRERKNHTLQPTVLVHEAYMKLVADSSQDWENRARFFSAASNVMRQLLIQHAREKKRLKRGGEYKHVSYDEADRILAAEKDDDLIRLDEALNRLAEVDKVMVDIVVNLYFAGLTIEETAEVMDIAPATVKRKWKVAKARLYREMKR